MAPTVVYLAHPYGGDTDNLDRAEAWLAWCIRHYFPEFAFKAPWIPHCRNVPETEGNRAAGLAFDRREVLGSDEVWLFGERVSPGMRAEASGHPHVRNLTELVGEFQLSPLDLGRFDLALFPALPFDVPAEPPAEARNHLIMDTRTLVGNSVLFWREGGQGYCTSVDEAGRYTQAEALDQERSRNTDRAIPLGLAQKLSKPRVDFQNIPTELWLHGSVR